LNPPQHIKKEHHVCQAKPSQAKPSQAKPSQAKGFFCLLSNCCCALFLLTLALPASANCRITHYTLSNNVDDAFRENGGYNFKNYDAVCNKLSKANAMIVIFGTYGTWHHPDGRQLFFGWSEIALADKNNANLISIDGAQAMTRMSGRVNGSKLLWEAINMALDGWTHLDTSLDYLNHARQSIHKPAAQR